MVQKRCVLQYFLNATLNLPFHSLELADYGVNRRTF